MDQLSSDAPTKVRRRFAVRAALALTGSLLVLGVSAPLVNASHFASQIDEALERALGRNVRVQQAHFTLFSGPGFYLTGVTIGEEERYGLEPSAYVPELDARLRIDKLLLGRIEFATLRLVEPTLNLVEGADGTWNFVSLLERLSAPHRAPLSFFPAVEVSSARINFKLGLRKTTLYFAETDLSIYPEHSGLLRIQFRGSPARTDRSGPGFGRFHGDASWHLARDAAARQLEANLILDRSNLSELTTLLQGHDVGVHGLVSGRAQVAGPVTDLAITGDLYLDDLHRWDLLPAASEDWHVRYRARLDVPAQTFNLETVPGPGPDATEAALSLRVQHLLARPRWSLLGRFRNAPAANLVPLAYRMGIPLPNRLKLQGRLDGAIGVSSEADVEGVVTVHDAAVTLADAAPVDLPPLLARIERNTVRMEPATLPAPTLDENALQVAALYDLTDREMSVTLTLADVPVEGLRAPLAAWFATAPPFPPLRSGRVTGQLTCRSGAAEPELWSGRLQLADALLTIPDLAIPLERLNARIRMAAEAVEITHFTAMLAGLAVRGDYSYRLDGARPEQLRVEIPSLDLGAAQQLLNPVPRPVSWLEWLRIGRRRPPAWLRRRNLEGEILIARLIAAGKPIGSLSSHVLWQDPTLQVSNVGLRLANGTFLGRGSIDWTAGGPRYRMRGELRDFAWNGGTMAASGRLESSGSIEDALRKVSAEGTFRGDDLWLTPEFLADHVEGIFTLSFADGWPNLHLAAVQARQGDEDWSGEAASNDNGLLLFDLAAKGRQLHLVNSLDGRPLPPESIPTAALERERH